MYITNKILMLRSHLYDFSEVHTVVERTIIFPNTAVQGTDPDNKTKK